jgi:hypothetical protein
MFPIIRAIWSRTKPTLEAFELLGFAADKSGLWAAAAKFGAPLMGVIAILLAHVERAPLYLLFLSGMAAIVLALAMVYLFRNLVSGSKIEGCVIESGSDSAVIGHARPHYGTSGLIAIGAAVIVAVIGTNLYNNWGAYQTQLDQTTLDLTPIPRLSDSEGKSPFGVDLHWKNSGPLAIRGIRYDYRFNYPKDVFEPRRDR